jgi:chromosome segregation ATPase
VRPSGTPAAAPPAKTAGVERIVQDIRDGLAEISAHEIELRRREQDFDAQYRRLEQTARQAAARELEQAQRRLAERNADLSAQLIEVTRRQAQLDQREERLASEKEELERQRAELLREAEESRRRVAQLEAEHQAQRETLRGRVAAVRRQEQELTRRIQLARDQIAQERSGSEQQAADLDARAARAAESETRLQTRQAEIDERLAQGQAQAAEFQQRQTELAAERAALQQERERLREATGAIEGERRALAERQSELDRRWRSAREQRHEFTRQTEGVDAQRRSLQQEQAALGEREERLAQRDRQVQEQTTALEAEQRRLAELEADLAGRVETVDALFKQAEEVEQQAREHHDQALAAREQAEAREREAGQAALALEVERRELERDRAALETASQKLDGLRAQREQDMAAARRALADHAERLGAWEQSLRCASRYWWRRATILAGASAVLAVAGWIVGHPPLHRAAAEIRVTSDSPARARVIAEHAQRLLQPHLLDDDPAVAGLAAAWRAACEGGRVTVGTPDERPVVNLRVTAGDAQLARRLVEAAGAAHERRVNSAAAGIELPPEYRSAEAWRDGLASTLGTTRQERAADAQALAAVPGPEERERVIGEADRLQTELTEVVNSLKDRRAALAALAPEDAPRGTVDPADVETALVEDTVYQEDRKEFAAVALQYRTELAVTMLMLTDPAKAVQKALEELAASLDEQRNLTPPAEVSAVLEACAAEVTRTQEQLKSFVERWRQRVEAVQGMKLGDDVVELANQQNAAAEAARTIAAEVRKVLDTLQTRIDALGSSGAGGTREVVVGAVLRGDQTKVKSAAEAFLAAAGKTALNDNFELDTQDRRARGLRMRLAQRREAVQQRLQLDADRVAAQARAARVAETRQQLAELEARREELIARLMSNLKTLRGLDEAARQRAELEGRISRRDAQIGWLEKQIAELEQKLADARRQGPKPDRVAVGEVTTQAIRQVRYEQAALAGGGAFVAAWLVCMFMMGRTPWRARRREPDPLLAWLSSRPGSEAGSSARESAAQPAPPG